MASVVLRMPKLAMDMTSGRIVEWFCHSGDQVECGEPLALIETDKAQVEFESPYSGVIADVIAPSGAEVAVGEPIARLVERAAAAPGGA